MAVNEVQPIAILMPEVVLYKTLKSIFQIVKDDFQNHVLEDTILYQMFGIDECGNQLEWENFNYFKQAKELFIDKNNIQVNLGYNMEVSDMACVHIMLPNETGRPFGIGADENYIGYAEHQGNDETVQAIYTKMFDATYNLIITSENTLEVLLIYNFLKGAFISLYTHIELSGLRLPKISGQDIQLQSDLVPPHIFHRSLGLNFVYEVHIPDLMRKRLIKEFKVTGIKLSNQNEDLSC
jgi:hypothetical protein